MKKGWEVKTVGDYCLRTKNHKWTDGSAETYEYVDLSSVCRDSLMITSSASVSADNAPSRAKKIIAQGDVIFATTRPTLRRVAKVSSDYDCQICSTGFTVMRPDGGKLDTSYLFYYIQTEFFMERMEKLQRGASYPAVTDTDVKESEIPIPPLSEQEEIVEVLDTAFAAIDQAKANIEQNIANAKELFQSKLNQIFSQKGEGWVETTLKEQVELVPGYAFKSKEYDKSGKGVRLLRGDNIMQGYFRWEDVKMWPKEKCEGYEKFELRENDVVLAMDRPWVAAGLKVSVIKEEDLPCLQVQRTARLRTNESLSWQYLFNLIRSDFFINFILGGQTGIGVPHISGKQILSFAFSLPSIEQQELVANNISSLSIAAEQIQKSYQTKLASLDELKKSILQKAFAGELT